MLSSKWTIASFALAICILVTLPSGANAGVVDEAVAAKKFVAEHADVLDRMQDYGLGSVRIKHRDLRWAKRMIEFILRIDDNADLQMALSNAQERLSTASQELKTSGANITRHPYDDDFFYLSEGIHYLVVTVDKDGDLVINVAKSDQEIIDALNGENAE